MKTFFKTTLSSIRDKSFGSGIATQPLAKSLKYWTFYLILFSVPLVIFAIGAVTYFIPQLPRLARKNIPEGWVSLKSGQLSWSYPSPFYYKAEGFSFIVNPDVTSIPESSVSSGLAISRDQLSVIMDTGNNTHIALSKIPDFYLSVKDATNWFESHLLPVWLFTVVSILILAVLGFTFYWVTQSALFVFGAVLILAYTRITHRELTFNSCLNYSIYASVISLLFSFILPLPGIIGFIASLLIFGFFIFRWLPPLTKNK